MDEEDIPSWYSPQEVDAIIANDGDEFLANADADAQGGENFYGQNQSLAGDAGWWDDNYPGQTTNNATSPTQDAYGLRILDASQTQQLTRNIDPRLVNSLIAPGTATQGIYVDANGVAFDSATGLSLPVNSAGRQIIPENVAITPEQQLRINLFNQSPKNLSANAVQDPERGPQTEYRQTVAEAARLNEFSEAPNPYLTQIQVAGERISESDANISQATQNIQTAQQRIVLGESIIEQNNRELADPNITAQRRAQLEANNLETAQNIFDQNQNITINQDVIAQNQDTIQAAESSINENAASYRDTTNPANTTTVDVNANPNLGLVDRVTALFSGQPLANPAAVSTSTQVFRDPLGSGGFVNAAGNPVTADGIPITPVATTTFVDATIAQLPGVTAAAAAAFGNNPDAELEAASAAEVGKKLAQQQAVLNATKRTPNNSDWRIRLSLAPGATYLYNAPTPGILWPLRQTSGVVFPYTPKIEINYRADYESYALTHSNYKGYFYKSSSLEPVTMTATFTAQDTSEAQYLLAVIHFFRSVTKMFYGQDDQRGAPPPLVYLTGLGEFQFTQNPCVVTAFNYQLPGDVDYIRARSINVQGTDLLTRRDRQNLPTNPISGAVARLQNLFNSQGINKGADFYRPSPPNLGQNQPTYVPTKLDITLTLLPVQSRRQVTQQFSVKQYANGDLLKKGFW